MNRPVSDSMKRVLQLMQKHGAAEKCWGSGDRNSDWRWKVNNEITFGQVDRAIQKGLVVIVGAERTRAVLTDRGRRFVA